MTDRERELIGRALDSGHLTWMCPDEQGPLEDPKPCEICGGREEVTRLLGEWLRPRARKAKP